MNYDQIFAPHKYFWQIGRLLIAAGLKFLAKVTITSSDSRYHVGADYARVTSLFFHRPGKALIVQLDFDEHYGFMDGDYDFYWSFEFFCEEAKVLWEKRIDKKIEEAEIDFDDNYDVVGAWELLEAEGLNGAGGSRSSHPKHPGWEIHREFCLSGETIDRRKRMSPEVVAAPIIAAAKQVEPALGDKFHELSAWGFCPSYVFPGCEPIFWSRFPTRRLRLLADRVIGIKLQPD